MDLYILLGVFSFFFFLSDKLCFRLFARQPRPDTQTPSNRVYEYTAYTHTRYNIIRHCKLIGKRPPSSSDLIRFVLFSRVIIARGGQQRQTVKCVFPDNFFSIFARIFFIVFQNYYSIIFPKIILDQYTNISN